MATQYKDLKQREKDRFNSLCHNYDRDNFKKAFQEAAQILSVCPNQPETLSMKGLCLLSAPASEGGNPAEAEKLLKAGLFGSRFQSYICWHSYGIYHRKKRNFEEAVKCYKKALDLEKENLTILRDVIPMQMQVRDFPELVSYRQRLLKLQSGPMSHWVSLSVGAFVTGNLKLAADTALQAITRYRDNMNERFRQAEETGLQKGVPRRQNEIRELKNLWLEGRHELGDLHIFYVTILMEQQEFQKAIEHLQQFEMEIANKLWLLETRAKLYLSARRPSDAVRVYQKLLERNPDNAAYHEALFKTLSVAENGAVAKTFDAIIADLLKKNPRSMLCRISLIRSLALQGNMEKYLAEFKSFLEDSVNRSIPTIHQFSKSFLYASEAVTAESLKIALEMVDALRAETGSEPTKFVYAAMFTAQVLSRVGKHEEAIALITEAGKLVPTYPDVFVVEGKVRMRGGDFTAVEALDKARALDLNDRYLNIRCAKYMALAGNEKAAEETAGLFIKENAEATFSEDLVTMQARWWTNSMAKSFLMRGDYGHGLKFLHHITKLFDIFRADEFDFHYYCMRKNTIPAYLNLMHFEDCLPTNPFYVKSVTRICEIYLELDSIKRNAADKFPAAVETTALAPHKTVERKKGEPAEEEDPDREGKNYLAIENYVAEAEKLLNTILLMGRAKEVDFLRDLPVEIYALYADVCVRSGKFEEAVKALDAAKRVAPACPKVKSVGFALAEALKKAGNAELDAKVEAIVGKAAPAFEDVVGESFDALMTLVPVVASTCPERAHDLMVRIIAAVETDKALLPLPASFAFGDIQRQPFFAAEDVAALKAALATRFPTATTFKA